jgi:hypothetical protein
MLYQKPLNKKLLILLCVLLSFSGTSQINNNLLIYYPFDGNSNDASGNNYHGQDFGVAYTSDRFGNPNSACYFNGTNSYINFPNLNNLKPNLPVSFSFWIKYDNNSFQNQVVFNTSYEENRSSSVVFNSESSTNKYVINYADGTYSYSPATRRSYVSNSIIDTNNWHNIVIVVTGSNNMKIYVDCVETSGTYSGTGGGLAYSTQPGCLGRHDRSLTLPADYFKGDIDEFRYWDRALNENDVTLLCQALSNDSYLVDTIKIYPNPAKDILYISSNSIDIKEIEIYNYLGQEVYNSIFKSSIDVSNFKTGVYVLKVSTLESSFLRKIIIE